MRTPALSREDMMEAIALGVERAMWSMITNATMMPCADFYEAVTDGVERAHKNLAQWDRATDKDAAA